MICQKQSINSGSGSLGGGTSVWGYLTAGVVAANVVANLVNNANENNNNNNNNDNQDNTNNNNMNIGNSVNSEHEYEHHHSSSWRKIIWPNVQKKFTSSSM